MDISKVKAIVTGAASPHGLGFATAKRLIDAGGSVVMLDVNDEEGNASANGLGERAAYLHADVSSEEEVRSAIVRAAEMMDGITLAVNCAGIIGAARALGREAPMPGQIFENTLRVNLLGSFLVSKEAANIMQQNEPNDDQERGVIISTASIAAFEGQIGQVEDRMQVVRRLDPGHEELDQVAGLVREPPPSFAAKAAPAARYLQATMG